MTDDLNKQIVADGIDVASLKVHQMPKKYKSGSFDYSEYNNKILHKKSDTPIQATGKEPGVSAKKSGLVVVIVGILLLGILSYGVYWYVKNKDFSLSSLFGQKVNVPVNSGVPHQDTPTDQSQFIPTSTSPIVSTSTEETPSSTEGSSPALGSDSDADGLSDVEEMVLGTDSNKADTDGDTYSDMTEIMGLYNAAGTTGNIYSMPKIKKYTNTTNKYSLAYPSDFTVEVIDNGASIIFKASDESFIQVIVQDNEAKDSISAWYEKEFAGPADSKQLFSMGTFSGVRSTDNLTTYFTDSAKNKLYIISYTPLETSAPIYSNIMELMLKSFAVTK